MSLSSDVIKILEGKTISVAESLTGGGIGAALTGVPGSSAVFAGGVISYTNEVKQGILGVPEEWIKKYGAVSPWVAMEMASGVRGLLHTDVAVAVTGLAGPGGDDHGHPVGTVYIAYEDKQRNGVHHYLFEGDRDAVRSQSIEAALKLIILYNS